MTILANRAKCLHCQDVIESTYRHDFRTCSCGKLSVDGGRAYTKRLTIGDGQPGVDYQELSEYA